MKTVVLDSISQKHADEVIRIVEDKVGLDIKMKDLIKHIFADPNDIGEYVVERLKKRIQLVEKKDMKGNEI